jgi:hypothetical protein
MASPYGWVTNWMWPACTSAMSLLQTRDTHRVEEHRVTLASGKSMSVVTEEGTRETGVEWGCLGELVHLGVGELDFERLCVSRVR